MCRQHQRLDEDDRLMVPGGPNYAREIATIEFGCGLDGVIRARSAEVSGILFSHSPERQGALQSGPAAGDGT
jgi:hypothetical protein